MSSAGQTHKPRASPRRGVQLAFALSVILFLGCLASLPAALLSVIDDLSHPTANEQIPVSPTDFQPAGSYTRLHVDVVGIDEVSHEATLRVNGYRYCDGDTCGTSPERVVFYQVDRNDAQSDSIPASQAVVLPARGAEITTKITLPIRGSLLSYPFDTYALGLGVVVEREGPDGKISTLSPTEARSELVLSVQEQLPRVDLASVEALDPAQVRPSRAAFEYAYAPLLTLERPAYLRVVVVMVALLSLAVSVYTLTTRPFDQLVVNAGALILGIWGARSLLLGGYPVDVTLLDTLLTGIVLFMLLTLTFRAINFFHRAAALSLLPWAGALAETTRKCPECLSKIPVKASRCASCTAVVLIPGAEEPAVPAEASPLPLPRIKLGIRLARRVGLRGTAG